MPELPEVETICRGIAPHILGQSIQSVTIRQSKLRWPVPRHLVKILSGQTITAVSRRGKYVLLQTAQGTLLIHLGMSGSLRLLDSDAAHTKHDHVDIMLCHKQMLRYNDPRRFGCILWLVGDPYQSPLLRQLGPEPLTNAFNAEYLYGVAKARKVAIKTLLMNSHVVVGVGNIYANEALFMANIHPQRAAQRISQSRYQVLVEAIKHVLTRAIHAGGTTLRDFVSSEGKPGYFQQQLYVYGRAGEPCFNCQTLLKRVIIAQRATVYCPLCQR